MKDILEKIKTDKKVRNTVICSVVGAVIVIALAVAIPVSVHSSNVKKALAEEQAVQTAEAYEANSEENTETVTEPVTEETTTEVTEPTTAVLTTQSANNASASKNNTASDTGKGSSSGSNSSSSASSKKPSGSQGQNNPPAQQETPAAPAQSNEKNPELAWTQADVDAAVAEAKQYAKSKGLIINSDKKLTITIDGNTYNTSWASPIDTRLDYKSNAKEDLHYQIDRFAKAAADEGVTGTINIFAENHGTYWEIYVVC